MDKRFINMHLLVVGEGGGEGGGEVAAKLPEEGAQDGQGALHVPE